MVNHRNYPIKSDNRFCRCKFTWDGPDYKDRYFTDLGVDICFDCMKVSPYFGRVCPGCEGVFIIDNIYKIVYGNYPKCYDCEPGAKPASHPHYACIRPKSIEELLDGL